MTVYATTRDLQADTVVTVTSDRSRNMTLTCEAEATVSNLHSQSSVNCTGTAAVTLSVSDHVVAAAAAAVATITDTVTRNKTVTCTAAAVATVNNDHSVTSQAGYELFVATGAALFDFTTPDEIFTSLPHTTTLTLAAGTHRLVLRYRNRWGYTSENIEETVIVVDSSIDGHAAAPANAESVSIVETSF